ncbi:EamA domain-containing membrane protein RarD [Flagellimonas zhangzhouensis]|uniref:EamA domain-containing membrane protein RarD n=2 Tax=Flagellimonas zhangzhouensis TaxID=1073328 RepID=A0A1H2YCL2_9FLAO|nr:EamA domain-containing membrane protein RarD [Allomuricauda zhangzhouensis]SDX02953.1 EamA domain-containing membrane protein RarD [Allomuricauda zhangzhouensis]
MLISTLSFTGMNSLVKHLVHLPTFEIVFFRSLGSAVLATCLLLSKDIPLLGNRRKLLTLRAILGLTAMSLFFMSLKELPVGTAVSLRYLSPIIASILAIFLLKESLRGVQLLLFAIAFSGVLILKGFDANLSIKGLALVMIAAVFSGAVYIVIRKIGKSEHPLVIVNYFMVLAAILGLILALPNWEMPQGIEWLLLSSLGVFGFFGQLFMTKAFQIARTNQVAPFKYLEVVFTVIIGITWFNDFYGFWSFVGLAMIVISLVLNSFVKTKA